MGHENGGWMNEDQRSFYENKAREKECRHDAPVVRQLIEAAANRIGDSKDEVRQLTRDVDLWKSRAQNLAVMVRRLIRAIHKYEIDAEDPMPGPCSKMMQQADDMLELFGLRGSPLREEDGNE